MFASALDWPGWCRSGRTEQQALEALAKYAGRYAVVGTAAGFSLAAAETAHFDVVERVPGNVTTDVGAPAVIAAAEREPLDAAGGAGGSARRRLLGRFRRGRLQGARRAAQGSPRWGPRS